MAPKRGPAPIAAKPGRPLLRPCCPLLCRAVVGLLKEDDVPPVALQKVEEAAPLVSVPEAVDVEAEKAQGGRSGASHGCEGRRAGGPSLRMLLEILCLPAAAPAVAPAAVATTLWADAAYVLSAAEPAAPLVRPAPHAALRALRLLATQSPAGRWASPADVQWVLLGPLPAALGPPVSEPASRTSRPASCLLHGCDAEHRRGAGAAAPYLLVHPLPTRARVVHRCAAGESLPRCLRGRSVYALPATPGTPRYAHPGRR